MQSYIYTEKNLNVKCLRIVLNSMWDMSQLYNSGTGAAPLLCAQGTEEPAPAELNWLSVHSNEHYVN